MEAETIPLASLVGMHILTGVDRCALTLHKYGCDETCEVLRFVLDGVTYMAIQNPSDGWRSSMDALVVSTDPVNNCFPPVPVLASYRTEGYGGTDDVLELRDQQTGKIVLEVGTHNTDDYYPCFVATFHPEHMAINQTKEDSHGKP